MSDERRDDRSSPEQDGARESWLERLMHRFNLRPRESIREDLQDVLSEATEAAELPAQERTLLTNALAFHRVRVSDVMVPRADIVAAPIQASIGEILGLFRRAAHSRLPLYGDSLDEPLGMVHIRDLMDLITAQGESVPTEPGEPDKVVSLARVDLSVSLATASIVRSVLFVPGSMPAIDLLARMQASRTHIALVIDEYGGTDGLVSIEDLLETVVGDIEDEHDVSSDFIVRGEAGEIIVDARAGLDEVSDALGVDLFASEEGEYEVNTVGGLVVMRAGRVPLRGEVIPGPLGFEFEVLDADRRRLKRLRIRRASDLPSHEGALRAQSNGDDRGWTGARDRTT